MSNSPFFASRRRWLGAGAALAATACSAAWGATWGTGAGRTHAPVALAPEDDDSNAVHQREDRSGIPTDIPTDTHFDASRTIDAWVLCPAVRGAAQARPAMPRDSLVAPAALATAAPGSMMLFDARHGAGALRAYRTAAPADVAVWIAPTYIARAVDIVKWWALGADVVVMPDASKVWTAGVQEILTYVGADTVAALRRPGILVRV